MSGSNYCSSHTCYEPGCYREVPGANDRCATHKAQYYASMGISTSSHPITTCNDPGCSATRASGTKYSYSGKSSYSSSKKSDSYNASKYDDYEDFYEDYYDDFEGIDDAEDYWDEHH